MEYGKLKKEMSLEQKVQRALDYQEIQNVMAWHAHYHSVGSPKLQTEEIERIWVRKTPGASFTQDREGSGVRAGIENVRKFYAEDRKVAMQEALERLRKWYPDVENKEENYGMGTLVFHTLTTPCIEVAGDGKTAKGVWYSPSVVTEIGKDGRPVGLWIWEKYGIDFAKEDGEWKIWHMHCYYDFICRPGQSWTDTNEDLTDSFVIKDLIEPFNRPLPPDHYELYNPRRIPKLMPKPPLPYETFDEETAY